MVTASCRIGYDFSTPDGPLTMKLAETPSRRAGLIISVFGVASSPMESLLAWRRSKRTRRGGHGQGAREGCRGSRVEGRASTASFELRLRVSSFDCEFRASTASFEVRQRGRRAGYFCWGASCFAGVWD